MLAAEGHDKPLKYPAIFARSDAVVLNKIDLAALCNFDRESFYAHLRALTQAPVFEVSCRTGEGLATWITWLTNVLYNFLSFYSHLFCHIALAKRNNYAILLSVLLATPRRLCKRLGSRRTKCH